MHADTSKAQIPDAGSRLFNPLGEDELAELLTRARDARIAVVGDYCLDVYWSIDPTRSERSLETGLDTRSVRRQHYALGGAGNVVHNLMAAGCRNVRAFGVVGSDPWGREMRRLLREMGADISGLCVQRSAWMTPAYIKPLVEKEEQQRIDFGNYNELQCNTAERVLANLEAGLDKVDVVVINQQLENGLHVDFFREKLNQLMRSADACTFIVDSRHFSELYEGAILKLNDHEAARLIGQDALPHEPVSRKSVLTAACQLYKRTGYPVVVTRGNHGVIVQDAGGGCEVPGLQALGQVDSVGAGDSLLAGLALGLAVDAEVTAAAQIGNYMAGVTVQKLHETGTASPQEIIHLAGEQPFVYYAELAEDPRAARFLPNSEIEVVRDVPTAFRATHAIFDHDGTISTLRQGWEDVMEPMMIKAILGPRYDDASASLVRRVAGMVREYIDRSTGVQTLVQMEGLVKMVRDQEFVAENDILSAIQYKRLYNDALMEMVQKRVEKLRRNELSVADWAIKNAVPLLGELRDRGVKLYLASGTDQEDVIAEAEAMGYAQLFDGGIFGSVGSVANDAKRLVINRILAEIGSDPAGALVTFGDGPVEIRETSRRGGLTVGVATDEIRRHGLNLHKRERLIKAGADLVIPDFSQLDLLLRLLV